MENIFASVEPAIVIRVVVIAAAALIGLYVKKQKQISATRRHESNQAERELIKQKYGEK